MRSKLSLRSSASGFTLLELLVTSVLALILGALIVSETVSSKRIFAYDMVRTRIDQNLRSAMDVLASNLRVGGENLPSVFPAFEIVNGSGSDPDELYVRRNLIDEVLSVCQNITAGSTALQIYFAVAAPPSAACTYSGQTHNYNSWRDYRQANGDAVDAYIFDVSTKQGEFFRYSNEGDSGTEYHITRTSGSWQNAYLVNSASIYILEEWRFRLENGVLQLLENGETTSPKNIASGITQFSVKALMQDGSTKTTLLRTDDWSEIDSIEVTLAGEDSFERRKVSRSLTSSFFPRNILSN
jgi:hypothetical protein